MKYANESLAGLDAIVGYNEKNIQFLDAKIQRVYGVKDFECIARFTADRKGALPLGSSDQIDISAIPLMAQFLVYVEDKNSFSATMACFGTEKASKMQMPGKNTYTISANGDLLAGGKK